MKNIYLTLTVLIGFSFALSAQNVGIGTTNPQEKLHIDGSLRGNQSGAIRIQTPSGYTDVGSKNASWSHFSTDRPRFYFDQPVVVNTGEVSAYSGNMYLRADYNNSNTADQLVLETSGEVGIGTSSPGADLHVYRPDSDIATIAATGGNQGTGIIYAGQSTTYGGGFGYNGDGTPSWVGPNDDIAFFRREAGTDHVVFHYPYNENRVYYNSIIDMQGNKVVDVPTPTSGTDAVNKDYVDNQVSGSDEWTRNGNDIYPNSTSYLVGIGNSNPSYALDVTGNSRIDGNLIIGSSGYIDDDGSFGGNSDDWMRLNGYIELKSNTDNYGIVLRDKDNNEYFGITQKDGYSYLTDNGTSGNYFLRGNGSTTYARGNIITEGGHIYGRSQNNSYSNLYRFGGLFLTWDSDSYGTNDEHSIRSTYGDSYGDNLTINSYNHVRLNLDANDNDNESYFEIGDHTTGTGNILMRFESPSGNLGIGTTDPTEKLDVNGQVRIRGGSPGEGKVLTSDANGVATWGKAGKGEYNSGSVSSGQWYRIAYNPGNRANAKFILHDGISGGGHSTLVMQIGMSFGYDPGMSVNVLSHSYYSTPTFTKVRILENTSDIYDNMYVEVYVQRSGGVEYSITDNLQSSGWIPVDWTAGSIPSGYTAREVDVNKMFTVADNSTRLTVNQNGYVGINTDNPGSHLEVNGRIKSNGINETSDARLKKDVNMIEGALGKVLQMEGVTYNWKRNEYPDLALEEGLQYGLIAQDLEQVIPELVHTDTEGWKSVEYSHLVPVLIEGMKEQQDIIDNLQGQNQDLEARVGELENAVNTLLQQNDNPKNETNTNYTTFLCE